MALFGKSKREVEEQAPPNRRERRAMSKLIRRKPKTDGRAMKRALRADAIRKKLRGE